MKLDTKKPTPFSFEAFKTEHLQDAIDGLVIDACHYHDIDADLAAVCAIRLARKAAPPVVSFGRRFQSGYGNLTRDITVCKGHHAKIME